MRALAPPFSTVIGDEMSEKTSSTPLTYALSKRYLVGMVHLRMLIAVLIVADFFVRSVSQADVPALAPTVEEVPPILAIDQGKLIGYQTESGPYLFNNIPFAQPPVGKLRWLPPQLPPPSWTGVRDAQAVPNMCFQYAQFTEPGSAPGMGSEDCLYLNVYTNRIVVDSTDNYDTNCSNTRILNPDKRLSPVMVFVYGGSSTSGWSSYPIYDQSNLVADRDIVAVTINYRVGIFGYLALDVLSENQYDKTGRRTSGNYGLLDVIAALKWVKANIAAFGGDPSRVTIYGQSTGGTNVVCMYISPLARGLFHAVLSLSASPVLKGDLAFAFKQNEPFLSLSGCDKKTTEETLDCIYNLTSQDALSATPPTWLYSSDFGLVNFTEPDAALIIVDDYVIPAEINNALSHGYGAEVTLEYGHMAQEIDLIPAERPVGYNQTEFVEFMTELTPTLGWTPSQTENIIQTYPISDYGNDSMLTYESIADDYLTCASMVNLNNTATSRPRHTAPIFHHIIHYHPSVPFPYIGIDGWNISRAAHLWDLLVFLESYPEEYPATMIDQENTELLRELWADELATKGTITDTDLWPPYNEAELSGKGGPTWTLEFLESSQSTKGYVATPNYHGDRCVFFRENGFAGAGWAN